MSQFGYSSSGALGKSLIQALQGPLEGPGREGGIVRKDRAIRNLALAILIQAFRDILSSNSKLPREEREEIQKDACSWFYSDEDTPGSLAWVSEIIDIQPSVLRDWLTQYTRSDQASRREMARPIRRMQLTH